MFDPLKFSDCSVKFEFLQLQVWTVTYEVFFSFNISFVFYAVRETVSLRRFGVPAAAQLVPNVSKQRLWKTAL